MNNLLRAAGQLAAIACCALPLAAAESTVEERLKALEQTVQQLAQENAELKRQLGWKEAAPPVLAHAASAATAVKAMSVLRIGSILPSGRRNRTP